MPVQVPSAEVIGCADVIIQFPMRIARRFLVGGRVQGVGFRYYVQDVAMLEGVTGYVRNLPDGRVEAHVEGDAEAVTRVERAIRSGPAGARVEHVDTDVLPPTGNYKSFSVTH
jgi:acylphosphatase